MTTIRDIFNAFAPESLERSPHLPTSHHKVISAIQHCRSGHDGHRLSQCQSCGKHHRVNHSCGHRHCPQCQHHKTQQWLQHHLDKQLPGPHCLVTFTVPATLRPFFRSHQRLAYQAMFTASSQALTRLAQEERFIGTNLPGFTGILHTWGSQLQSHPHIPSIVPGGGLAEDRTTWRPSRANFSVPVKALSPLDRALFKEAMDQAGLLAQLDPLVWHTNWNVHSQANPNGHTSFQYLAPSVFKVAISNSRLVSLQDRTVTFTYRKPGSARPHTTHLDGMEFLRRFLPHVLPDGFMKVRHFGLLHTSCAIPTDTLRLMIVQAHLIDFKPPQSVPPAPLAALCPTCGAQMRVVMRLWTSHRAFVDTG
jgi:Putative transposase/Transposase zinc-binding domain